MPCPEWTVRPAVANDANAIANFHLDVARDAYAGLVPPECLTALHADTAAVARDIANPRHHVIVGVSGDETVVGYADGGAVNADEGVLLEIWVAPQCRGTSLAAALFRDIVRELAARGCTSLTLIVAEGLTRAREFYGRKLGGIAFRNVPMGLGAEGCPELVAVQYVWPNIALLETALDALLA